MASTEDFGALRAEVLQKVSEAEGTMQAGLKKFTDELLKDYRNLAQVVTDLKGPGVTTAMDELTRRIGKAEEGEAGMVAKEGKREEEVKALRRNSQNYRSKRTLVC